MCPASLLTSDLKRVDHRFVEACKQCKHYIQDHQDDPNHRGTNQYTKEESFGTFTQ